MRRSRLASVAFVGVAMVAGCADAPEASERDTVSQVRVGLIDYEITTPTVAVEPGRVTFEATNAGRTAHDLKVSGDAETAHLPTLAPGESATLEVDVARGDEELTLWCSLPGHRGQGMETTLPVADPPEAAASLPSGASLDDERSQRPHHHHRAHPAFHGGMADPGATPVAGASGVPLAVLFLLAREHPRAAVAQQRGTRAQERRRAHGEEEEEKDLRVRRGDHGPRRVLGESAGAMVGACGHGAACRHG